MADRLPGEDIARHLLKSGFATDAQITDALRAQAERALRGTPVPLAQILVEQGVITAAQREGIEKKLEAQREDANRLGPYRIVRKLGEGGMGAVYLAEDPATGGKVALKILPRAAAKNQEVVKRFLREVDSVRKLEHPNIVRAGGSGEDKGFYYYVMEYVEGVTLGARLKREEFFSPGEATKIVLQVAYGLKFAHDQGFIHRDIKPDNIIVSGGGAAKILDMGLSKNIEEAQTFRTVTGVAMGTPHYMAPEQARGEQGIDGRADIYSLGATYYHMVTGETPFHGTTALEVISQHLSKQLPDPRDVRDGVPDGVVHVIRRMMAKKPQYRYQGCGDLLADLERVVGGLNPMSQALEAANSAVGMPMDREARERFRAQRQRRPPGTLRATKKTSPRRIPLLVGGGVLAAVALMIVLVMALGGGKKPPPAEPVAAKAEPEAALAQPPVPKPAPLPPRKTPAELREEKAQRKLNEIQEVEKSGRFAADGIRLRYEEFAREYGDTSLGKEIATRYGLNKGVPSEPPGKTGAPPIREYFFLPDDLKATGTFKLSKLEPKRDMINACWLSETDLADSRQTLKNYVEISFYALPETTYKGWVYVGGCCSEVLGFYLQGSELTDVTNENKTVPCEPEGRYAAHWNHGIGGLKTTHASHGGAKDPEVWGWGVLPVPKYAAPGLKVIRMLSGQKGCGVAYAVISSTRTEPPTDAEMREIAETREIAEGRVISINFTKLSDTAGGVLAPTTAAGVISRTNWNNYAYDSSTYGLNPKDDTGTTLEGTFVNYRVAANYGGNFGYTSTVGNDNLMKYFCGNDEGSTPQARTQKTLIRVSGLPASFTAAGYSIYVYSNFVNNVPGGNQPTVLHKLDLGTSSLDAKNPNAGITVRSTATIVDSTDWPGSGGGTFTEGANGTAGNYIVFRNQTASEFAIFPYCARPARVAINGIQIVSNNALGGGAQDR